MWAWRARGSETSPQETKITCFHFPGCHLEEDRRYFNALLRKSTKKRNKKDTRRESGKKVGRFQFLLSQRSAQRKWSLVILICRWKRKTSRSLAVSPSPRSRRHESTDHSDTISVFLYIAAQPNTERGWGGAWERIQLFTREVHFRKFNTKKSNTSSIGSRCGVVVFSSRINGTYWSNEGPRGLICMYST